MSSRTKLFTDNDMILEKGLDGTYKTGGYKFNNELLSDGKRPFTTLAFQNGGNPLGSLLQNLAVPTGLLYLQQNATRKNNVVKDVATIDDTLYESLLKLASKDNQSTSQKKEGKQKSNTKRTRSKKGTTKNKLTRKRR